MNKATFPLRFLLVGAIALSAVAASAQVTKAGGGYLLRAKYKKGQTIQYVMTTSISMGPKPPQSIGIPMSVKVLNVVKDVAELKVTMGAINGKGQPHSTVTKVDRLGRPVGASATPVMASAFPEKAVKIGETWSSSLPMAQMGGDVVAKFIMRGLKTVSGHKVAVIDLGLSTASSGMNMNGKGQMQVLASDGSMYHMNIDMDMVMPSNQGQPGGSIHTVTTMVRK